MEKTIGILGGLGPYAGLDVSKKVLNNTIAKNDYEHINQILISFAKDIPDRFNFLTLQKGENPALMAVDLIERMISIGAETIGIACNQMHAEPIWSIIESNLKKYNNVKLINMIKEVSHYINQISITGKIGIMARTGVIKHSVYSTNLLQNGYNVFEHNDYWQDKIDDCVVNETYGIKNFLNPVKNYVTDVIDSFIKYLVRNGVTTIVIACTELPFAINYNKYKNVNFIDSSTILARALIRESSPNKLTSLKKNIVY